MFWQLSFDAAHYANLSFYLHIIAYSLDATLVDLGIYDNSAKVLLIIYYIKQIIK